MMNKLKVAVVGAGIYGKHHINAYLHNPDVELVAVCDNNTERCHAAADELGIAGYASLPALLDEQLVDVISVATSDPFHKETPYPGDGTALVSSPVSAAPAGSTFPGGGVHPLPGRRCGAGQ